MKLKFSDLVKVYSFVREHWSVIRAEMEAVEQFKGAKTGAEKKAAILEFARNIYDAVDKDSTEVTPAMVEVAMHITEKTVDATVSLWNRIGKFKK